MDSLKQLLSTVAPWIGTALGGPLGASAAVAITQALGLPPATANDSAALKTAIMGANPEQLMAIKKQDQDFALQMQALGFNNLRDMEALAVQDRASARDREVKTGDSTNRILAMIIVAGWFTIQWYILKHVIASDAKDLIFRMLGTLDSALILVLSYYFGSSNSSDKKTTILSNKLANSTDKEE